MKTVPRIVQVLAVLALLPIVHADLVTGPEIFIIPLVALIILGAIVVGVIFAAILILMWIKNKSSKK